MKEEIETTLQPLIGEPLTDMWRYGCQKFEFGVQRPFKNRKGRDVTCADWGFVVSCFWRIVGPEGKVVSSEDFGPNNTRRDQDAIPFYESLGHSSPVVQEIVADETGAINFRMTGGYTLEVRPTGDGDEEWRFMPKDKEEDHFVLRGGKLLDRDKSIRNQINDATTKIGLDADVFRAIPDDDALPIIRKIEAHFVQPQETEWERPKPWWQRLSGNPQLSRHFVDGFEGIPQIVPPDTHEAWFVVDIDVDRKHLLYEGTVEAMEKVIAECFWFTHYVVSPEFDWLMGENNADEVFTVGEAVVDRLSHIPALHRRRD